MSTRTTNGAPNGTAAAPSLPADRLALRKGEVAKALGISIRTLWNLTHPRGPIRTVHLGSVEVFPLDELKRFLADEVAKAAAPAGERGGGA